MFDLDGESLWMGPKPSKKKRQKEQPLFGDYGASNYGYDDYEPRPRYYKSRSVRPAYRKKQKQYSVGDYAKATVKGAKSAYGGAKATYRGAKTTYRGAKKTYQGISKFVSKTRKPGIFGKERTLREKLRGSIYKKEK